MKKKQPTVHLIGNAHIDPVWLWNWEEGVEVVLATFRQSIDLIKKHPEYTFTASSALFYKWVEELDPELFAEIRKAVRKGRWFLAGGWMVEPDLNIPSGESLVRQGLYGQRYFQAKFGMTVRVGYNPDGFGHNAALPQILKKMGINYYLFTKPIKPDQPLPTLFWWEGPDGSRLLTFKISGPGLYSSWLDKEIEEKMRSADGSGNETMVFFGAGDHGNGTTPAELELVDRLRKELNQTVFKYSSPVKFFDAAVKKKPALPVFRGEIQHYGRGCYSSCGEIKELNRRAEHLLLAAEKISVFAKSSGGFAYPAKELGRAWQNLLFCQFHDILAGSSIIEAYDDVKHIFGESIYKAKETINNALQRICLKIDTRKKEGLPLVIFNSHAWPVRAVVEFENQDYRPESGVGEKEELILAQIKKRKPLFSAISDEKSKPVLFQTIKSSSTALSGQRRFVFIADLPALGYRTYFLNQKTSRPPVKGSLDGNGLMVENGFLKISFSRKTGYFDSIYDKQNQIEFLDGPAGVPVVIKDESDAWGHSADEYRAEIGRFQKEEAVVAENGPVRILVRVKYRFHESLLWQDFILYRNLNLIEAKLLIDWREHHKLLKLSFPVRVKDPKVTYQTAYGFTERPADGKEEPGQQWFDVTGRAADSKGREIDYGLTIANSGRYSFDVKGTDMRMTILRSAVFAYGDFAGEKLSPPHLYRYMDQGVHTFSYRLFPHAGPLHKKDASRSADELNLAPFALVHHKHPGTLSLKDSFVESDAENVIITVLKESEDNHNIILRCYETEGKRGRVNIKLPRLKKSWQAKIEPFEIKTFLVSKRGGKVRETNLLEF